MNWIAEVCINITSITLHVLGLYALVSHKPRTNQSIILSNLSGVELLLAVYSIVNDVVRLSKYKHVRGQKSIFACAGCI